MSFWIRLIIIVTSWFSTLLIQGYNSLTNLYSVLFFSLFFLLPILKKPASLVVYCLLPVISLLSFWESSFNLFYWFVLIGLMLDFSQVFSLKQSLCYNAYIFILLFTAHIINLDWTSLFQMTSFFLLSDYLIYKLQKSLELVKVRENKQQELVYENVSLKRQMIRSEELARQEERTQIAREIHDSVGHRLTALLMQLEVARFQSVNSETREKYQELKELAQQSLDETRTAVKALKSDETAGIQAIINLIRKLEAESHLEIQFIMQSGILNVKLSNRQSIAVYRSIQESLTNMMRHSQMRKASIDFSLLGGRYLQFKVTHDNANKQVIEEGFGLKNMRQRLEEVEGTLTITQDNKKFVIIGQFPIHLINN